MNKAPNKPLSPLEAEFVKLVLSQQGQQVVVKRWLHPAAGQSGRENQKELGL